MATAPREGAIQAARKGARGAGRSEAKSLYGPEHAARLGSWRAGPPAMPYTHETFRSAKIFADLADFSEE